MVLGPEPTRIEGGHAAGGFPQHVPTEPGQPENTDFGDDPFDNPHRRLGGGARTGGILDRVDLFGAVAPVPVAIARCPVACRPPPVPPSVPVNRPPVARALFLPS